MMGEILAFRRPAPPCGKGAGPELPEPSWADRVRDWLCGPARLAPPPPRSPAAGKGLGDLVRCLTIQGRPVGRVLAWDWRPERAQGPDVLHLRVRLHPSPVWLPAHAVAPCPDPGPPPGEAA